MSRERKLPKVYLQDILDSVKILESYIGAKTWEDFASDVGLQDKIIRRLEIIGEAAKYVPEDLREQTPEIPWILITDMRNVLIHEYFGIDLFRIWEVAAGPKLKELKSGVGKLLLGQK